MKKGALSLGNLSKSFGATEVVTEASLDIVPGEFFSILGPSGCGKTTLLRMIAGFEMPDRGRIQLEGRDITALPPSERGIGMVFQNYALFPHMNVFQNVAYGLGVRRTAPDQIRRRVENVLASVGLSRKIDAPVTDLSGGEQQRVALARALVIEPAVLLLDEPLSNLDVSLRQQTREELRTLQRSIGITTVYVTHDQSEALMLSDRLAIMRSGILVQIGAPRSVYESPGTPFVARFLGRANIVREGDGPGLPPSVSAVIGQEGCVAIRPESIVLSLPQKEDSLPGRVVGIEYQGFVTEVHVLVGEFPLHLTIVSSLVPAGLSPGSEVGITIQWGEASLFPDAEV
jgi:ABC-type Fe3+/spermidine/putrescine transport system ATPase subunit